MTTATRVRDNAALSRYEMEVDGGVAFIRYRRNDEVVSLLHAEVPVGLRGRGLGSRMTAATLELVRAQGERVIARCPFVAAYVDAHPEYGDLVAND